MHSLARWWLSLCGQSSEYTALLRASHVEAQAFRLLGCARFRNRISALRPVVSFATLSFKQALCISHSIFRIYIPPPFNYFYSWLTVVHWHSGANVARRSPPVHQKTTPTCAVRSAMCSRICYVKGMGCFAFYWGVFLTPKLGFSYFIIFHSLTLNPMIFFLYIQVGS